jgi:hypothetical protein
MRALDPSGPRSRAFEPARFGPQGPPSPRRPRDVLTLPGGSARHAGGSRYSCLRGRGRLVDYGAALEMRFGATRRGFESRPLRQTSGRWPRGARPRASVSESQFSAEGASSVSVPVGRSAIDSLGRARRGTSGALYLQTALAGLNSHPRSPFSRAAASSDVEDRVPRSGESRTVSGPEGSSTKRISSGAAERPGPSRSLRWARKRSGRRWVHGTQLPPARHRTGAQ